MRLIICFLLIFIISSSVNGQTKADTIFKLYDYQWKETKKSDAAVFYTVAYPESSKWRRFDFYSDLNKFQMDGYYSDKELTIKHGLFKYYNREGKVISTGNYLDNKKHGLWKKWHGNGQISDSSFFVNDIITSKKAWFENGKLSEEIITADSIYTSNINYFENGNRRWEGNLNAGLKTGKWTVYDKSGKKNMEIMFEKDSAIHYVCFNANGEESKTNCEIGKEASFKNGEPGFVKYLQRSLNKQLSKPSAEGLFGHVIVVFIVDIDGSILNPRIEFTNNPKLNKMALEVIRASPKWEPAIMYNEPVKAYRLQPFTFAERP